MNVIPNIKNKRGGGQNQKAIVASSPDGEFVKQYHSAVHAKIDGYVQPNILFSMKSGGLHKGLRWTYVVLPKNWKDIATHPINIVPAMTDQEMEALVESFATDGFDKRLPIILLEGKIIDGVQRFNACKAANVEPYFAHFQGTMDQAKSYILRTINRRSLKLSQRLAIAVKFAKDGQKNVDIAKEGGFHRAEVSKAKKVREQDPETFEKMEKGEITTRAAYKEVLDKSKPKEQNVGQIQQIETEQVMQQQVVEPTQVSSETEKVPQSAPKRSTRDDLVEGIREIKQYIETGRMPEAMEVINHLLKYE